MSCGVVHRHGSDTVLLWLWPAALAPVRSNYTLSLWTSISMGAALKRQGRKGRKKGKEKRKRILLQCLGEAWVWSLAWSRGFKDSCHSDSIPGLGPSICHGCGHLKTTTKPHTNVSFNSETIWKYVNCRISLSKDFAAYVKKITYKGLLLENPRSFQCKPLVKMEAILLLLLKKDWL